MKRLCYLFVACLALISSPVLAQCSSCSGTAPSFQSVAYSSAPMNYRTPGYGYTNWTPTDGTSVGYSTGDAWGQNGCCQPVCRPVCQPVCRPVCRNVRVQATRCNSMVPRRGNCCQPAYTYTSQRHFYGAGCCNGGSVTRIHHQGGEMYHGAVMSNEGMGNSITEGVISAPEVPNGETQQRNQVPAESANPPSPDGPATPDSIVPAPDGET